MNIRELFEKIPREEAEGVELNIGLARQPKTMIL